MDILCQQLVILNSLFYGPWSMRKNFETEYIPSYMNKISRKSKYEQQQKVY